ncbi:MAG: Crp/Fnr family transcriptional regulator [Clostridia bacterium]|nr:Crp/Fnr family transcriptional regulator [Clostridia bacterium]
MRRNFDPENFIKKMQAHCNLCEVKEFQADEVITTFLLRRNQFCILLEGEAQLITYDSEGNKKILYYYKKNDLFGEALFKVYMNKELFVLAKKKCRVLFYPYDTAENCTNTSCIYHIEILRNLPDLILHSIAEQNFRMILLTYKGVRDKLLTYFNYLSIENSSKTIELPFSLTDLADYLMIERTAMMRELKRLQDEKIIKKNKSKIVLL